MIPMPVIAAVARLFEAHYTRTQFENLFNHTGTSVESPGGNKMQAVTDWLKAINREEPAKALAILGSLLEDFFEAGWAEEGSGLESGRNSLHATLSRCGLRYVTGGTVVREASIGATKTLQELLKDKNFPAVGDEFTRATSNVDSSPREAASAAANILEAVCKEYIVQHPHLTMPGDMALGSVFKVVRKDLGLDPSAIEDDDLKTILSGLITVVDGIAKLRTHASSAHSQGTSRRQYRLNPRHARLAVNAAHTLVAFILETWESRETTNAV